MMYLKVLALPMHMPLWHSMYIVVAGVGYINIIHYFTKSAILLIEVNQMNLSWVFLIY